ncbi:hypothetical protein Tco_0650385 [Tanacetum coccineum]
MTAFRIVVKLQRSYFQHWVNVKKSVAERKHVFKDMDNGLVVWKALDTESEVQGDKKGEGMIRCVMDADIRPIYEDRAMAVEKVFAIAALKNDLRKLKGNSVDTKFAKTSVLGKLVLQSLRNQSVVRQQNSFKSERPQMSKQRNSSKNMPRFSLNDMVHNHYLDETRKKTQERDRNSKTSVMPSARFQSTANGSKPKPRSNNQTPRSLPVSKSSCVTIKVVPKADHSKSSSPFSNSKYFFCSTCHKCVFNANHDACITKLMKEVNSHAKIQSHTTRNRNKPVDQKSHTQKPGRQIFTGHRFSPNKTSVVYEKTSPRSDQRWKPTGRIFKSVGLRWIRTGKTFNSCTNTLLSGQKQQTIDLTAGALYNVKQKNLRVWLLKKLISQKPIKPRTLISNDVYTKWFKPRTTMSTKVHQAVKTSPAVTTADASDKRQQQPDSTSSTSTQATSVTADGNFDL